MTNKTDREDAPSGVITEADAAKEGPFDGEKASNDRAAQHRSQKIAAAENPVITEADAAKESSRAAEKASNERAARLRRGTRPRWPRPRSAPRPTFSPRCRTRPPSRIPSAPRSRANPPRSAEPRMRR